MHFSLLVTGAKPDSLFMPLDNNGLNKQKTAWIFGKYFQIIWAHGHFNEPFCAYMSYFDGLVRKSSKLYALMDILMNLSMRICPTPMNWFERSMCLILVLISFKCWKPNWSPPIVSLHMYLPFHEMATGNAIHVTIYCHRLAFGFTWYIPHLLGFRL